MKVFFDKVKGKKKRKKERKKGKTWHEEVRK
jgi:hypothetical protein